MYGQLLFASIAGLLSHWTYYIHGEHDLYAARIARVYCLLTFTIIVAKVQLEALTISEAVKWTSVLVATYGTSCLASIATYRIYFSPLRHFPGPLRLSLTKLTHLYDMAVSQNCKNIHNLQEKYGDAVRIALFTAEAFEKVHGPESMCGKALYYDLLHPMVSLDTTRDPVFHAHRRKVWDQAFSFRSLSRLESIVYEEANELVSQLDQRKGQSINISEWLEYYTFDLMGRFGLTLDFHNMCSGKPHPILTLYRMAHDRLGPLGAAPWIKHLLMGIPYIERMKYYRQFMDWAAREVERNVKNDTPERTDVLKYVIDDAKKTGGVTANWNFIIGDFVLVMAAGSDPMRQVLANLLYYLIVYPAHLALIRQELDSINTRDYNALQKCSHLTACIYETLRLNPAVPSGNLRQAPRSGLQIGDTWIPGGTTLCVPQYTIFRDVRNYVEPTVWIPERHTTKPELTIHDVFRPWSAGSDMVGAGKYACIGKNLSLMEIRVAAALLLSKFDMSFAPGEEGSRMFAEACDFFTTAPGPLQINLALRASKQCV